MLTMCLSPTSDTIELLGSLEQREAGGLFEWVDSPLVKGIIDGSWVLIENAQLCSPSTLDRLNSLLEPNGELLLSERGLDANGKLITLKAHPDFRLILAVDEICGPTGGGGCSVGGSTGISRAMPIGLLEFHSLFLEACENPSCIEQHLQRFNERRQSSSPVANIFQLVTCHSFKKPPIGALISAGQYAKQLLANPSQLGDGSPLGEKSSNKMLKKKKKIKRIKRLKKSKREEIPVDLDEDDGDDVDDKCSSEVDINRILNHVLQFVYCQRQMHVKAIEFVKWLITYYVDNAFIDKASSTDTGSDQRLLHLPERYLHHSVNELVSRRSSPNGYRQFHVSLIDLTLSDYSTSSIITSELLLLAKRILLEQANPSETHLENDQFMKMLTSSSSSVSVRQLKLYYDLTTWPDLRWIPGWKHFIGLRLYSLLLAELYESTMNVSDVDSQAFTCTKPADLCHLPLLQVIKSASENHLPAMWLDAYPGLTELHDKWLDYLHNLWNQFPATSTSEQCDLSFFYTAICKAWSWIHLFACRPLGDSFDWPERCSFHNQRAVLTSDDRFNLDLPKLSTITQCFLSKSTPPSMITGKEYEMYSSPMYNAAFCVDWLQFGQILNEFLLRLTSSSNGTSELNLDRDYSDNDDDSDSGGDSDLGEDSNAINDEDMMNAKQAIIPLSGTTDDHLGGDIYRDILKFYCLWPWTMILMSKYIETELLNTTHNSNNSSGNHQYYIQLKTSLRIYIRCVLMSLNRPGLLASLVMTQSVLKNSNTEQSRIAKQLLMEEFSMMPSSSTSSSTKMSASSSTSTTSSFSSMLSFLFQRLDWSLPSELTSLQTVNQPDILGEWRSVSQALINITWPMLYDYGAYAYRGKLTVYGWRYRQHIIQDANYLLFLSPPSSNELSNSPENDNLQ
ncbi:unnamed protein product [Trichobilharzia regenti]|nr:unnamed protein product [Trichobilharzia regenti]